MVSGDLLPYFHKECKFSSSNRSLSQTLFLWIKRSSATIGLIFFLDVGDSHYRFILGRSFAWKCQTNYKNIELFIESGPSTVIVPLRTLSAIRSWAILEGTTQFSSLCALSLWVLNAFRINYPVLELCPSVSKKEVEVIACLPVAG